MHKISLIKTILLLLCSASAFSQVRLGLTGSLNVSDVSLTSRVQYGYQGAQMYITRKSVNDYYAGIVADIKAGKSFLFKMDVLYSKKGWKQLFVNESAGTGVIVHNETTTIYALNTIQVPVTFMFTSPLGSGRMYIGTGPYIDYNFSGSGGNTDSLFKKTDYGIRSVLGFETGFGLFFEGGLDFGLSELYKEKILGNDTRYRNILVGVGFWFNRKKKGKNAH